MATGRDVFAAINQIAEYKLGRGLTAYIDLDALPPGFNYPLGAEELAQLERPVRRHSDSLLAPAEQLSVKLLESCKASGIFYKDPQRGWGVKLSDPLSEEQDEMMAELRRMIDGIPTYLNNIPLRPPNDVR